MRGLRSSIAVAAFFTAASAVASLKVVTTTSDLADITKAIGGNKVSVSSIASGRQDPHYLEAKPSYMTQMRGAKLFIRIGLELETGWEPLLLQGARNPSIQLGTRGHLDVSGSILRLEVPTSDFDRSMGDIHPYGNPHYWLDPYNVRVMARDIRDRLSALDPGSKATFDAGYTKFVLALDNAMFGSALVAKVGGPNLWALLLKGELTGYLKSHKDLKLGGWLAKTEPLRGVEIVTYHRSWSYFANRFGVKVIEELEPKPGIAPSPGHVLEVIKRMRAEKARIILMEPFYGRKAPDLVAEKTGGIVVVAANSVGGQPEAKDYISMVDNVINRLLKALG
jgi:zinc/manganese transport system substrate-binding protein